ncbi:alpha/beta fold hydrolase [Nonlabens agnitus]|uniref:Alpha/beta hydrolase n=1 Tax=Nonlabens agnitus TaxID=870484 RepID=A0A2S9WV35_9FLAO|nr:alpha/beta hydrolase [Nonlabens agnitus]PRP67226.1 alpha/beta hydrolase [Nonlabens agnitus]
MLKSFLNKAVPKLYGFYFNLISLFSQEKAGKKALHVFSHPRAGKIQPFQNEFLNTARKQKLITEEGFVQLYHWKGQGKTILLIHGWESNSWRWKYLIDPLRELDYNIISIDAPAHGASSGTDFTAVKYSREIKKVIELYQPEIIIAHSVGAMATIYQESQHPHDFIEKIILLGGPDRFDKIMNGYQKLTGFNNKVYQAIDDLLLKTYGFHISEFNSADFVQDINAQVLLIHSKQDAIVSYESMPSIASRLKNASTYTSKTGGHSLHTPEVVDQILAFL